MYGLSDKFDLKNSHVIPALMMKAHEAVVSGTHELAVWGSGKPFREFLYVDDLADALIFLLKNYSRKTPINIGSGEEISISDLAKLIARTTGFKGKLTFDFDKPDGMARKIMDSSKIKGTGWTPRVNLQTGLKKSYEWYLEFAYERRAA